MKARIPVKPITFLGLINVVISKLLLLIVVSLFLPYVSQNGGGGPREGDSPGDLRRRDEETGGHWYQFLPGFISESDTLFLYSLGVGKENPSVPESTTAGSASSFSSSGENPVLRGPTSPRPSKKKNEEDERRRLRRNRGSLRGEDIRKRLFLLALVLLFDILLSSVLTLSLAKSWFCGIWPWIVFRLFLACGLFSSAFAMIIQNLTMNFGQCSEWDLINVLNILATIIFLNVYVVYSYYWNKNNRSTSSGPPLLSSNNAPSGSHHPMYSSIGQGSEDTTITMELDDVVVGLTPAQVEAQEDAEIADYKAHVMRQYSSFLDHPQKISDPNATL